MDAHVLHIEDDAFLADIYARALEHSGFKVSHATNGETGLKDALKKKPSLVLLDVVLPRIDGFTVLERMKADIALRDIPVVMLTTLGQKQDVERGMNLGAAAYFVKGHTHPEEVIAKIISLVPPKIKKIKTKHSSNMSG